MLLLVILSVITVSNADVCTDLAMTDGATIGEYVNAGCSRTLISRMRRAEDETYNNEDNGALGDDHDHVDPAKKACEETENHYWCPSAAELTQCFDTSVSGEGQKYCNCIDGAVAKSTLEEVDSKMVCKSQKRTDCVGTDSVLNAFWEDECYTKTTCEAKTTLKWKAGKAEDSTAKTDAVAAICATELWFCGLAEGTTYTNNKCKCPKKSEWHAGTHCHAKDEPSKTAAWGYGFIAVAIISAFSIFGVIIVMFREKWWYDIVLSTMVALAVGCLLADALLHLIPLALGLHNHEGHGDEHVHAEEGEEEEGPGEHNTLNKCLGILGGVYLFLLFEKAIHSVIPHDHGGGGHEHGNKVIENPSAGAEMKEVSPRRESLKSVARQGICNVDSVAWMVIFGDALHNFADGLVLGASFASSLSLGLGTSIAVFCHELPHELGDFAVLLNAGMQVKWAIIFNFISACTCFLGLFIGLLIGEDDQTQQWIFAFTAGMFIYISCADLIPEMDRMCESSSHPKVCFALQQVGFWVGVVIMLIIALYEAELEALGGGGHNH